MLKQIAEVKVLVTGGHLTPALAVLEELKNQGFTKFIWAGHYYAQTSSKAFSAEYLQVTGQYKIPFINVHGGKIWRKWTRKTWLLGIWNLILIPVGFLEALGIILKYQPDIVIAFGGYLALPLVLVAKLFGKKTITHEQTNVVGKANKVIARFADKVLVSWPESLNNFPAEKVVYTGNPILKTILTVKSSNFDFQRTKPILLITGGNQGANNINRRIFPELQKLLEHFNIIHQTGNSTVTKDFEKAQIFKEQLPSQLQDNYLIREYIYQDEIGEVFAKADLVLGRSGANTCSDLLALGKLAVLMPIPWSDGNEQLKNAQMLEKIGLARIIQQTDALPAAALTEVLLSCLPIIENKLAFNNQPLSQVQEAARSLIKLDAAERFVMEVKKML
ncbi:MAG: UDP-N-acetylglucosamine--N-acetylmuramyl-(pentapeptide) pyrophosphoryl-undecaprenol N-acetylglucosamine transferase [bacterium]